MLKFFTKLHELDFSKLMELYAEGNSENARDLYPQYEQGLGILKAEQDFYQYLHEDFFCTKGAFYAVWEESGAYYCALRMEPYKDGLLLEALESHPLHRRKGYARRLISEVLDVLKQNGPFVIYSHVNKKNVPSLRVHLSSGFQRISENAVYIDGSVTQRACTMAYVFGK